MSGLFTLHPHPIGIKWWTSLWKANKNLTGAELNAKMASSAQQFTHRHFGRFFYAHRAGSWGTQAPFVVAFIGIKLASMMYGTRRDQKAAIAAAEAYGQGGFMFRKGMVELLGRRVERLSELFCHMSTLIDGSKRPKDGVSLLFDESLEMYSLGSSHPMKTCRAAMVVDILRSTNCPVNVVEDSRDKEMKDEDQISGRLDHGVMSYFHSSDYLETVRQVGLYRATGGIGYLTTPEASQRILSKYNISVDAGRPTVGDRQGGHEGDCPGFSNMYEFCNLYTTLTVSAARRLAEGKDRICLNFHGGMHHAKQSAASGFCYVNDCVVGIIELLRQGFKRVVYIDVDIHHGDGVEEAFFTTDKVLTISFHKYGNGFFPSTGAINDIGLGSGRGHAINVPLHEGIGDATYIEVFKRVIDAAFEKFKPEAIVSQMGADSLAGDRLGCFNLSHVGHSETVMHLASYGLPMIVLGGGGYTLRNVPRCWAYETCKLAGVDPPSELPEDSQYAHFYKMSDHDPLTLDVRISNMLDRNTPTQLHSVVETITENCREYLGRSPL